MTNYRHRRIHGIGWTLFFCSAFSLTASAEGFGPDQVQLPVNERLFDLTLNRMPSSDEIAQLNSLVELPPSFLEDLRRDGFAQRVLPTRPGVTAEDLLALGEVSGVALPWGSSTVVSSFDDALWLGGTLTFDSTDWYDGRGEVTFDHGVSFLFGQPPDAGSENVLAGPLLLSNYGDVYLFPESLPFPAPSSPDPGCTNQPERNALSVDVSESGLPIGSAGVGRLTDTRMTVTQGLPAGVSVTQESAGACEPAGLPPDWPFSVADVANVIAFNEAVLTEAGLDPAPRARILVVDSGLPAALIAREDFRRILDLNRVEAMGAGEFAKGAEDASAPAGCRDVDHDRGATLYGFLSGSELSDFGDEYCVVAADPLALIEPPLPTKPVIDYDPAHGAMVAGLAAGGPELIAHSNVIHGHLGVTMARIVRNVSSDPDSVIVASSINDALSGIWRASVPFQDPRFHHPQAQRFDVLNLSLSLGASTKWDALVGALEAFTDEGGLIVVAAGNGPEGGSPAALDAGWEDGVPLEGGTLPAVLSREGWFDRAILVGGTQPGTTGVEYYARSNWSPRIVDIAAPATGALSFGLDGGLACAAGTSVSTPQVSFVAAMLVSFGMWNNAEVKRRILATADLNPMLAEQVRDGRSLDVVHALDLYADLVWMRDPSRPNGMAAKPRRVRILSEEGGAPGGWLLHACERGRNRFIDTRELALWERDGERVRIWRVIDGGSMSTPDLSCEPANDHLPVIDLADGTIPPPIPLEDVARIVPSRFRLGDAVLRAAVPFRPAGSAEPLR